MAKSVFDRPHNFRDELALSYEVEAGRSYRLEIDTAVPPWRPEQTEEHRTSLNRHDAAQLSDNCGPLVLFDAARDYEYRLPHFRYARAISPQGSVTPVSISTVRGGDDGIGTEFRVRQTKQQRGFLFVEPGDSFAGLEGDRYLAWCLAVADYRRDKYEQEQRQFLEEFTKQQAELARQANEVALTAIGEQGKRSDEQIASLISQMTAAIAASKTVEPSDEKPKKRSAQ